ncbi:MAG: DUF1707 SHOCT-like domain-containing protein [Solirubrobacteraceae bacterium]
MNDHEQATGGVRASDADRERLAAELNEHTVEGRLSTDELEQRLQEVYAARTTAELDALRRDLPETPAQRALTHAARRSQLTRRLMQETGGSAALFVVCTVIWLASGAHGQFWPVWVLILVVMSLARSGWALFGPAPDLDAVEQHLDRRRSHRLERDEHRRGRRGLGR